YLVVSKFCEIDLHPDTVSNIEMGYIFEELIRRFNEASNEEAGDHFTPREVIRLMVDLLFAPDSDILTTKGIVKTLYDPACGTGGMLSVAEEYVRELNPDAQLEAFGQDYNAQAYAICGSDMMLKGQNIDHIAFGNSFTEDHFPGQTFDYMLANPPFGVEWKPEADFVRREHEEQGFGGRFGAGLPRINDGSLLFLLHMISKMKPVKEGGTRLAIVFNGSPLFTGAAGSGESEIRRWIIENDWLEAIVALPEQMFYNTGIGTFVWVLSNRKEKHRKGKIQLIDARERWTPMKRSLGNKRRWLDEKAIDEVTREHGALTESKTSKVFDNADFGYRRVTILRPLRLKFQITQEAKERYLDTCPELLDAVLAIEEVFGSEAHYDWNQVWDEVQKIVKRLPDDQGWAKGANGTAQKKNFRDAFTEVDPEAKPVIAKEHKKVELDIEALFPTQKLPELTPDELKILFGLNPAGKGKYVEYEADSNLKDFENIPLKEDVISYVLREVRPYVADAWIDRETLDEQDGGIGKVGYEINFNREFFQYQPPRPLTEIDAELEAVEKRIMALLQEVTE
ncbi:MAG TPA: DNA methyltransferase, partial [Verrucomicrobiales bacterium]|nr:DNA methyltransferase [Verrucomicrobiales bacterium]